MKCSLKWLRQYVDIDLAPEVLAKRITMAGTEVSHVEVIGGWENVFVGQIAGINPHPNADRLRLATVNLGGEQVTVVCRKAERRQQKCRRSFDHYSNAPKTVF